MSTDEPALQLFIVGAKRAGAQLKLQFFGGSRAVGGAEAGEEVEHNRIKGERDERVDQNGAEDGGDRDGRFQVRDSILGGAKGTDISFRDVDSSLEKTRSRREGMTESEVVTKEAFHSAGLIRCFGTKAN